MGLQELREELILVNTGNSVDENGYKLIMKIFSFLEKYRGEKIAVFLHTSTVLMQRHNLEILAKAASTKVKFYIPENCACELKFLQTFGSKPVLRRKAKNLLDKFGNSVSWSHCVMCEKKHSVASYYGYDKALFVFCEPAAASEFSKRFYFGNKNYILSFDPYFGNRNTNVCIEVGASVGRSCIPIKNSIRLNGLDLLTIKDIKGNEIKKIKLSDLGKYINFGGEAKIYQTPQLPGKLIKIYSKTVPCQEMVDKIKWLSTFYNSFDCCAFPYAYVYCNDNCVGFVMDKVEGESLGYEISRCLESNNEKKKREIMINLSVSLLESRINQLIVADLSPRNAIVRKDGRVVFIDVDSMEFGRYPGGSVTYPYGHPGFNYATDSYRRLRTLEETNFAYSVLLFWLFMGYEDPLLQKNAPDEGFDWNIHRFPLANSTIVGRGCEAKGLHVNEEALSAWKKQSFLVRNGFVDVFTNHKTYDIGEWLKILNLV